MVWLKDNGEDDDDEDDSEDEAVDGREFDGDQVLPWDILQVKRVMAITLYIYDYDIFAIYKGDHRSSSRPRYGKFMVRELKLEPDKWDLLRPKYQTLYRFLYVLFMFRFSSVCMMQLFLYSISPDKQSMVDSNTTTATQFGAKIHQQVLESGILDIFGNALSDYPGISLIVYGSLMLSISYSFFLPIRYATKPINSPVMRFFQKPNGECKRMLLIVERKFEQLSWSLEMRKRFPRPEREFGEHSPICGARSNQFLSESHASIRRRHSLGKQMKFCKELQPLPYGRRYYLETWRQARIVVYVVAVGCILSGNYIFWNLVESIWNARCPQCSSPLEVLTFADYRSLFEIAGTMIMLGAYVAHQIINMIMHVLALIKLITSLKLFLTRNTLEPLRSLVELHEGKSRVSERAKRLTSKIIFRALVRLHLALDEYCPLTGYMSQQIGSLLALLGTVLLLTLTAGRIEGLDMANMRSSMITCCWIASNVVLVSCAYVSTKMIQMEQLVWSIMAQLKAGFATFSEASGGGGGGELESITTLRHLIDLWQKLASKQKTHLNKNSIRPYGICMTYRMVLRMNFSVITVAILAMNR